MENGCLRRLKGSLTGIGECPFPWFSGKEKLGKILTSRVV